MRKKLYIILGILFTISVSIFVFNSIYQNAIPKVIEEINNSSIGAILTAIITVLLLSHQSSSEEVKEKNVKVFEAKSQKFAKLIDELWLIWEDRVVSLEEINQLIQTVSKEIVLYTKPETVEKILNSLINIAKLAKPDKTDSSDREATKSIQSNIFAIIDELAKEIGLGGELNDDIRGQLDVLDGLVLPYIIKKQNDEKLLKTKTEFKEKYLQNFKKTIEEADINIEFQNISYENNSIVCKIKDSGAEYRITELERCLDCWGTLGVFADFWDYREFQKYRFATRGKSKDWFAGFWELKALDFINFNNHIAMEEWLLDFNKNPNMPNDLSTRLINHINSTKYEGNKTLHDVIIECKK